MKAKWWLLMGVCSSLLSQAANAELALDATRYVYEGDKTAVSVVVNNPTDREYGGQVWVDNIVEHDTRPTFVATPSFFKIKKNGGRQVFRLIKASDHMPKDKESIYWLNLQEIPPKMEGSGISMALRTRVKVIYRPAALLKGRTNAEEQLTVSHVPGKQFLVNSTPYVFAIGTVYDGHDKPIVLSKADQDKLSMFMPGDKVDVTGADKVTSVMALNDFGNMTKFTLKGPLANKK